ncbi:MAG: hypothetical protein J5965_29005 [Aeriscardovia sp.]|nr:hypothetical protein [Aeriscardovia sp.]
MKNNDININLNQPGGEKASTVVKAVKNVTDAISNAKWTRIVKVYLVMFFFLATLLGGFFAYKFISDKDAMHETSMNLVRSQKEDNIRDFIVTPKIQNDLKLLTYTLNADRAFLFELHNGKKNTSGLPFIFADMSYEEVNEEKKVDRIAMQFQDIPLTLYKYPSYLQKQKMIIGTIDEIEKIDSEFANHIKSVGGVYLGMIYISSSGTPLGFLCVSYHKYEDVPDQALIEKKLNEHDKTLTQLLDLDIVMKNN